MSIFNAILQAASVEYRADGELWGALLVTANGQTRMYAQFLPQYPHLNPPGWDFLAKLHGVSSDDVVQGWDERGRANPVAVEAFARLQVEVGKRFTAREVEGPHGTKALELSPLLIEEPIVRLDLDAGRVAEGTSQVEFQRLTGLQPLISVSDAAPPFILLTLENGASYMIQAPDIDWNADPKDWFLIETVTGVSAEKVATSWTMPAAQKQSTLFNRAVSIFGGLLNQNAGQKQPDGSDAPWLGRFAPLNQAGTIDLDALRRELVRMRWQRGERPFFFGGRNLYDMAANVFTLLKDVMGPHLFRYQVVRGANTGCPAILRTADGTPKLEVLDTIEKVRGVIAASMNFAAPGARKKLYRLITPPNAIAEQMINFADQSVPPIDTLVRIPTVRRDGTIHDTEGYDPKSRIWYAPEFQLEPIPDAPTDDDVRRAVGTILAPFDEFPFVVESGSRAATVACLIDQIVRPMIDGPRPLYAFDAPAMRGQGTGKTLLATAVGAIITGRPVEVTGFPDDPKELPKLITSKLLAGEPYVILDNLEGTVRHKDLASCATATMWSSRLLHTNESPKLPQTATWAMTLNGARFSRDIARRTITIKLDAKTPEPFKRTGWKIPDLIPYCIQNRSRIIRALLILARAWVVAGRPKDTRLVAGSFEAWQRVTGGILRFAHLDELPDALEESRGRDVDSAETEEFVTMWTQTFGIQAVTAMQLAESAMNVGLFAKQLERSKAPVWRGRHMTEILRKMTGQTFQGMKVERSDATVHGHWHYRLHPTNGAPANGA